MSKWVLSAQAVVRATNMDADVWMIVNPGNRARADQGDERWGVMGAAGFWISDSDIRKGHKMSLGNHRVARWLFLC